MATGVTLESVSAYGRRHGVSKAAAQKWEARGLLVKREGKVWVEGSDRALEHCGLGRFAKVAGDGNQEPATGNPATATTDRPSPIEIAADDVVMPGEDSSDFATGTGFGLASTDDLIRRLLSGETLDIASALRAKENGLALRQLVRARREADAVVDIEVAEGVLFEQARAIRDAWLNWPARAGPPMAAQLGLRADKVVEVLTAHVHEQLKALGDPEADFAT